MIPPVKSLISVGLLAITSRSSDIFGLYQLPGLYYRFGRASSSRLLPYLFLGLNSTRRHYHCLSTFQPLSNKLHRKDPSYRIFMGSSMSASSSSTVTTPPTPVSGHPAGVTVPASETEWRQRLNPMEYRVLRQQATEPPKFSENTPGRI